MRYGPGSPRQRHDDRGGDFHIDIAEVRTAEGKLYLFVAIDRRSKFAFVEPHERAATQTAADFLDALVKAVPYKIHTVLTDNGIHFTDARQGTAIPRARLRVRMRPQRHRPSADEA